MRRFRKLEADTKKRVRDLLEIYKSFFLNIERLPEKSARKNMTSFSVGCIHPENVSKYVL